MTSLKSLSFMTNNDNTMIGNELFRLLTNLGEKLTKEEAKGLMKELCEPEDDVRRREVNSLCCCLACYNKTPHIEHQTTWSSGYKEKLEGRHRHAFGVTG